ncbi:hypothetical protein O71_11789 [Pontibacter sp. BAB1700]|nr:hypothetical protein O71_11789 [Pontibacter sp. BAB1700]
MMPVIRVSSVRSREQSAQRHVRNVLRDRSVQKDQNVLRERNNVLNALKEAITVQSSVSSALR